MARLELKRPEALATVTLGDAEYAVRRPPISRTAGLVGHIDTLRGAATAESAEVSPEWVKSATAFVLAAVPNMPAEVVEDLDADQFAALFEFVAKALGDAQSERREALHGPLPETSSP